MWFSAYVWTRLLIILNFFFFRPKPNARWGDDILHCCQWSTYRHTATDIISVPTYALIIDTCYNNIRNRCLIPIPLLWSKILSSKRLKSTTYYKRNGLAFVASNQCHQSYSSWNYFKCLSSNFNCNPQQT